MIHTATIDQSHQVYDNNVLTTFLSELIFHTSLIIALYKELGTATFTSHDHWELINLIEKKSVAAATNAMVGHLNEIKGNLNLKKNKDTLDLAHVFKTV
jgi:DNA-binding GntR family transcriptional regulator